MIKADHDLEALIINDTKSVEVNTQYMSGRLAILHLSWYVVVAVGDVDMCFRNFITVAHDDNIGSTLRVISNVRGYESLICPLGSPMI